MTYAKISTSRSEEVPNKALEVIYSLVEKGVLSQKAHVHKVYRGSTEAFVLEVKDEGTLYAVKLDDSANVQLTCLFYRFYNNVLLFPKLLYSDFSLNAYAYVFITGERQSRGFTLVDLELIVKEILFKYRDLKELDPAEIPQKTILESLVENLVEAKSRIKDLLPERDFQKMIQNAQKLLAKYTGRQYLVHGDLGAHNAIYEDDRLKAIIDPEVVRGLPILELMSAGLSLPGAVSFFDILNLCRKLEDSRYFTDVEIMTFYHIQVYIRLGKSIQHHPQDVEYYLNRYRDIDRSFRENRIF